MSNVLVEQETLAVSTTAVGLTIPATKTVSFVRIKVSTAAIRWRADGTAPTASVGWPEAVDSIFELTDGAEIANFKAIRSGGSDGEINVQYFRDIEGAG